MDYEREKFYKSMIKKQKEIESSNISKEGKISLYLLITKNIQMYEQNKILFNIHQTLEKIAYITERKILDSEIIIKQKRTTDNQTHSPLDHLLFSKN